MNRILTLAFAVAMIGGAADAKACRDAHGKFAKCPVAVAPLPHCDKGKLCGHSCIKKTDVCHKP
jgi:hypothetical protein